MRSILALILFLLLGLATSVAIAWGATVRYIGLGQEHYIDHDGWRARITVSPSAMLIEAHRADIRRASRPRAGDDVPIDIPRWSRLRRPPGEVALVDEFAAGWPLPCLRFARASARGKPVCALDYENTGAIEGRNPLDLFGGDWPTSRLLPAAPIWGNLLIDTLLAGTAWFVLLRLLYPLRYLRAVRRSRREICPACLYDMRLIGSARCPECGCLRNYRPPAITGGLVAVTCTYLLFLLGVEIAFALAYRSIPHYEPIHRAAWNGDVAAIRAELARGVNADLRVPRGSTPHLATPLWLAACNGHAEAAGVLIEAGADISWRAPSLGTPLDIASLHGAAETVGLLLEAGADVHATDVSDETALHRAAAGGDVRVVQVLLEHGARVDAADIAGARPLHASATAGRVGVVDALLEARTDVNVTDRQGRTPLAYAVRAQQKDMTALLLGNGATINDYVMTEAVRTGRADIVALLIARGGDPLITNRRGETLLFAVDRQPEARALWELLVARGVDVNAAARGRTILMYAAREVSPEFFRFLLENGADPDAADSRGRTALDYAGGERKETIRRLLEAHRSGDAAPD